MARSFNREVEITSLGGAGDGVAQAGEERFYVPFTAPGDRVEIRVGSPIGNGHRGEMLALSVAGPNRIEPACQHFQSCGGCTLQHIDDDTYATWKREQIIAALARREIEVEVAPLVRVPQRDRRRIDLIARKVGKQVLVGLHEPESHRIVDLIECFVVQPRLNQLFAPLRRFLAKLELPPKGIDLKANLCANGIDLTFIGPLRLSMQTREQITAFAEEADIARITLLTDHKAEPELLVLRHTPEIHFDGIVVRPPPATFLQASPTAEAVLIREVLAGIADAKIVADLYAGIGTFSLPLAKQAKVLSAEADQAALTALKAAADRAGRPISIERRDLTRAPLMAEELKKFNAVVFDPPRTGAREQVLEIAKSKVARAVAVSCAPSTFARDAKLLIEGGFHLTRLVPIDQFLWSPHIELVAQFERYNK